MVGNNIAICEPMTYFVLYYVSVRGSTPLGHNHSSSHSAGSPPGGSGVTSPVSGGRVSLNGSYTSDPGYNSANNTNSSNHYSDHQGMMSL